MNQLKFGCVISLVLLCLQPVQAQRMTAGGAVRAANNEFVKKQFWIGPKFSVSRSQAEAETQTSSISPIDYEPGSLDTEYNTGTPYSGSFGLNLGYSFYRIGLYLEPAIGLRRYSFRNDVQWTGTEDISYTYDFTQRIDQFELPLSLHFDLLGTAFTPYLVGGAQLNKPFLGLLETEEFYQKGSTFSNTEQLSVDNTDEFPNWYGSWHAGLGLKYHIGNVQLFLQGTYGRSFGEINKGARTDVQNKFLTLGYSNDPVRTTNLTLDTGIQFPFKFLTNLYKSK